MAIRVAVARNVTVTPKKLKFRNGAALRDVPEAGLRWQFPLRQAELNPAGLALTRFNRTAVSGMLQFRRTELFLRLQLCCRARGGRFDVRR